MPLKDSSIIKPTSVDVKRLPIGAHEAYVLSRIDQPQTLDDLSEIMGLPIGDMRRVIERLFDLGAVAIDGVSRAKSVRLSRVPAKNKTMRLKAVRESKTHQARATVAPAAKSKHAPARKTVAPVRKTKAKMPAVKSEPPCDLAADVQARILALDGKLGGLADCDVLGVPSDASAKVIRRAYFALAAAYHPDKFFGKSLGPLAPVVQRVFLRITAAHERMMAAAKLAPRRSISPQPKVSLKPPAPEAKAKPIEPAPAPPPSAPVAQVPPSAPTRATTPTMSGEDYARASDKAYRAIESDKANKAAKARAQVFADLAQAAFDRGDMASAAQHFRLAIQVHVDPVWFERLQIARSAVAHAEAVKRARDAEATLDWNVALENWEIAHAADPCPASAERLASALLATRTDVRRAVALAQQATFDAPHDVEIRVTLAEALLVAGLVTRARTEIQRVLASAPDHERGKSIGARIRKAT